MKDIQLPELVELVVSEIGKKYVLVEKTFNLDVGPDAREIRRVAFIENVVLHTANHFGMTVEFMKSCAGTEGKNMKALVYLLCQDLPERSIPYQVLGRYWDKNHSSVRHATLKMRGLVDVGDEVKKDYDAIKKLVEQSLKL